MNLFIAVTIMFQFKTLTIVVTNFMLLMLEMSQGQKISQLLNIDFTFSVVENDNYYLLQIVAITKPRDRQSIRPKA